MRQPSSQVIQFPGGPVVINEAHIWSTLEAWLGNPHVTRGFGRLTRINGEWRCQLTEGPTGAVTFDGHSRVGMLDAIAQALTVAMYPEEE